jgi:hypothetical protein
MLTYADIRSGSLLDAHLDFELQQAPPFRMLTYADVCGRMRTYADVCAPRLRVAAAAALLPPPAAPPCCTAVLQLLQLLQLLQTTRALRASSRSTQHLRRRFRPRSPPLPQALRCPTRCGACVSMRQHTSAYVSIRQHTSAYVRRAALLCQCLFKHMLSADALKEAV